MKTLDTLLSDIANAEIDADNNGVVISANGKPLVVISRMINSSANVFSCVMVGESFYSPDHNTMMICNITMEDNLVDMRVEGNTQKLVNGINQTLTAVKLTIKDYGFTGMKLRATSDGDTVRYEYYVGAKPFITFIPNGHDSKNDPTMYSTVKEYRDIQYYILSPAVDKWEKEDADFTIASLIPLVHKTMVNRQTHMA